MLIQSKDCKAGAWGFGGAGCAGFGAPAAKHAGGMF